MIAPYEIWEMLQLRHLEIRNMRLVDPHPVGIDKRNDLVLSHLLTLAKVENFRLSEEVIRRMPNIRDMHLLYCDEASSYYCPQNLRYFDKLEYLLCDFDLNSKWSDFALSLIFPSSINCLILQGCRVDWEGLMMMVGSLPHLMDLRLVWHAVIGSVWTTVGGKFPALKHLVIFFCDDLVNWNVDSSHFPVLQSLELSHLSKLDEFPSGIGEIPTLQSIELEFCSITSTFSAMRTLVEQEELGNEDLQLRVSFQGDDETLESFNNQVQEEDLTRKNLYLRLHRLQSNSS